MELNIAQLLVPNQPVVEGGDGALPPHLNADFNDRFKCQSKDYEAAILAITLALVDQPEVEPILLGKPLLGKRKGKQPAGVPPRRLQQSRGMATPLFSPSLGRLEFSIFELGKQVVTADSTKDHDTSLAFAWAVMLPKILSTWRMRAHRRSEILWVATVSERMKQQSAKLKRTKKKARDASYATTTLAQNEVVTPTAQKDKALQELTKLRATACGPVYNPFEEGSKEAQANEVTALKGEVAKEGVGTVAAEAGGPAVEVGETTA
ncbi:hypothetical protein Acr_09g0005220 [Actinidia rufa]|uniref:Uncharacterized protein n=1 Tax=Actinidia rufa TaxID=165716 RepID=A0A7J0F6L7_9ERIC|nr:hypothetical protein Acr_09g0005220 [Actinidia rufa]